METVRNLIGGLGSLGSALYKLFTGDFRGAWEDAKEGAKKLFMANPITTQLNIATRVSEIDFSGAYARGKAKVHGQDEEKETADKKLPSPAVPVSGGVSLPSGQLPAGAALPQAASGATGSAGASSGGVVDLNPIAPARMGSTAYNASFYGTYERIRSKSARRFYHTDFIPTPGTKRYAYSEIAVFYYKIAL